MDAAANCLNPSGYVLFGRLLLLVNVCFEPQPDFSEASFAGNVCTDC